MTTFNSESWENVVRYTEHVLFQHTLTCIAAQLACDSVKENYASFSNAPPYMPYVKCLHNLSTTMNVRMYRPKAAMPKKCSFRHREILELFATLSGQIPRRFPTQVILHITR